MTTPVPPPAHITLGLLAGGRAQRLGGIDKAWLQRPGGPAVVVLAGALRARVGSILVSANRDAARYAQAGLHAVPDRQPALGPLGGLQALLEACATPWLLSLPVDVLQVPGGLVDALARAGAHGSMAVDDDGPQPLVALWPVAEARTAVDAAVAQGTLAVHALQASLRMAGVDFAGYRFGNLNTFEDLAAAGIVAP